MEIRDILFQAGMVGAFIVFAIITLRIESGERSKRQESFDLFIQGKDAIMIELLDREREYRKEVRDGVVLSMGSLTQAISKMDERSSKEHGEILLALHKLNGN